MHLGITRFLFFRLKLKQLKPVSPKKQQKPSNFVEELKMRQYVLLIHLNSSNFKFPVKMYMFFFCSFTGKCSNAKIKKPEETIEETMDFLRII